MDKFRKFLIESWKIILAIIGGIVGIVQFIQLWLGQQDIVSGIIGVAGFLLATTFLFFIGFSKKSTKFPFPATQTAPVSRFPKFYVAARIGLILILLGAFLGLLNLYQEQRGFQEKINIIIADFYGPDIENNQVTPDLIGKINTAFENNEVEDTVVTPLMQVN